MAAHRHVISPLQTLPYSELARTLSRDVALYRASDFSATFPVLLGVACTSLTPATACTRRAHLVPCVTARAGRRLAPSLRPTREEGSRSPSGSSSMQDGRPGGGGACTDRGACETAVFSLVIR